MSDESRVLLDMATLAEVEGEGVRARKLRDCAKTIEDLELEILSLENGSCRFHCRVRADMWKAGFGLGMRAAYDNANTDPDKAYITWRKHHG